MLRRLFVPLLAAFLGTVSLAAADPIFPPGQRIGLEPPPGLTLSTHFVGFEDPERKVIITILDLPPRAYAEAETSLFAENRPGVTIKSREMIAFNSGIGTLVTGNVSANGVTVHKWLLLASTMTAELGNLAALINVEVPEAARAAYPDAVIRAALASVTFRPAPIAERLSLLPFKLDDLAGLRVMQVTPGGVILVDGPADDLIKQAYMVVEVGQGSPSEPDARARFCARPLVQCAGERSLLDVVGADADQRHAGLRDPGAGQGVGWRTDLGGAVAALRHRRIFADRRCRSHGRLGRAVHPLPRAARRRRSSAEAAG